MKRFLTIILATFMLCACTGCSGGGINSNVEGTSSSSDNTGSGINSNIESASNSTDNTDGDIPEALKRQNEINYYTVDEVKKMIRENTRFNISEDFVSLVPKSVSYICSFDKAAVNRQAPAEFYDDFKEMFAYLFPNEKFNDDYFFYYYIPNEESNRQEGEFPIKNFKKYYDDAVSEKNVISYYFYSPYSGFVEKVGSDYAILDNRDSSEVTDRNIFLEFGPPIGNYLSNVNKGVLAERYCKDNGEKNNHFLENWEHGIRQNYKVIGSYDRDSTEKFRLLDGKEISVADAVTFFENYVNNAPCPKSPVYDMKVMSVIVQQYDKDKYFYSFTTTPTYGGIPFDWDRFYLSSDSMYETTLCDGSMVTTDDIDSFYGYRRTGSITDEKVTDKLLPFDKAISKIEQSLTEQVSFEVLSADLVYTPLKYYGSYDIPLEEQKSTTTPAWKVVIQNKNNDLVYTCYIDADTGENFRYNKAAFYTADEEAEG